MNRWKVDSIVFLMVYNMIPFSPNGELSPILQIMMFNRFLYL